MFCIIFNKNPDSEKKNKSVPIDPNNTGIPIAVGLAIATPFFNTIKYAEPIITILITNVITDIQMFFTFKLSFFFSEVNKSINFTFLIVNELKIKTTK